MSKPKNKLIDHDFDGIQEYDNDLPGWLKALFLITVIIAVIYVPYYHFVGDLQDVEYQKEMGTYVESVSPRGPLTSYTSPYASQREMTPALRAELNNILDAAFSEQLQRTMAKADPEQLAKLKAAFPDVTANYAGAETSAPETETDGRPAEAASKDEGLLSDETNLAAGQKIWDTQCFVCHLNDGGGSIGPNMTDNYWIHGGDYASIVDLIKVGVPAKGMIPWVGTLTPEQINQVASFIQLKLVGTSPAVAKAPQGDLYEG